MASHSAAQASAARELGTRNIIPMSIPSSDTHDVRGRLQMICRLWLGMGSIS